MTSRTTDNDRTVARDESDSGAEAPIPRWRGHEIVGLILTTIIGIVHLPMPFGGDAALMTVVGRQMAHGDVLYRDLLDIRQPIIFWFAQIGGSVFGFTEVGIHLAELIVLIASSAVMIAIIRSRVRSRWAPALAPLLTVGIYYAASEVWQLTEPESFAGIPLLAIAWIIDRLSRGDDEVAALAQPTNATRTVGLLLAMGALTAIVGLLKLTYLAIAGPMALVALVDGWRQHRVLMTIAWPTVGFVTIVGSLGLYFRTAGVLDDVLWMWFDFAPSTLERAPRTGERLRSGSWRFVRMWLAVLPLSAAGVVVITRSRRVDRLLLALAVWVVTGFATILIQHWWDYLFHVLIVPLGLLAVVGLDDVLQRAKGANAKLVLGLAVAMLTVPLMTHFVPKLNVVASNGFGLDDAGKNAIHDEYASRYADARSWRDDLGDDERPIHFVGDATSIWVSGRDQAIPVHGWAADFLDDELWGRMHNQISITRPVNLWLWEGTYDLMDRRSPATKVLVEREYCFVKRYGDHDWWVLRSEIVEGTTAARCS